MLSRAPTCCYTADMKFLAPCLQKHDSASKQEAVAAWEPEAAVSKYADGLPQLPTNGKTIPSDPSQWRCDESGVTENLWLNLSTGFIGSGRPVSARAQPVDVDSQKDQTVSSDRTLLSACQQRFAMV